MDNTYFYDNMVAISKDRTLKDNDIRVFLYFISKAMVSAGDQQKVSGSQDEIISALNVSSEEYLHALSIFVEHGVLIRERLNGDSNNDEEIWCNSNPPPWSSIVR